LLGISGYFAVASGVDQGMGTLGQVAPSALGAARLELHWAAQVVAAAADAHLPKRADDGHTTMRWDSPSMVGEAAIGLRVTDLVLTSMGAQFSLVGKTLAEGMAWADRQFDEPRGMHARDYDMPASPVATGERFIGHLAQLAELARWYDLGLEALSRITAGEKRPTDLRIWPHHFDLGAIVYLDPTGEHRQIGIGLSPGDGSYAEPYFYVTPYPLAKDVVLPSLPSGTWRREGWTGAVLTGSEIVGGADPHAFLRGAVDAARSVIASA
jgi:hypothetical protein